MFFKKKQTGTSPIDFMIVGLGNPGAQYDLTRHNIGFMAVDYLAEQAGAKINKLKFKALLGEAQIGGMRCLLLKPQTFMNNSGEAVRDAAAFYKLPPERILLLFDDISLPPGRIRLRRKGSDGGHNGVKSILYLTGSDQYPRIKLGVGAKPHPEYDLAAWVLSRFQKDEIKEVEQAVVHAAQAAELIVQGKIDEAMSRYSS